MLEYTGNASCQCSRNHVRLLLHVAPPNQTSACEPGRPEQAWPGFGKMSMMCCPAAGNGSTDAGDQSSTSRSKRGVQHFATASPNSGLLFTCLLHYCLQTVQTLSPSLSAAVARDRLRGAGCRTGNALSGSSTRLQFRVLLARHPSDSAQHSCKRSWRHSTALAYHHISLS